MVRDSAAVGKQSTTVSMVVTDIVGSTAMSERLGPDKTDEARRAHFETLRGAVAQTGGTEVKNLGDGLMVAYGSARDALEGAIAMQRAADAAARRGSEVAIRVGVATGDAFVEDGDYFGIPVVEAARLCSAARGGQILTTALVRMLTDRTAHGLHSVGQLELKGLAEPVEAFEVAWEVSAAGHEIPVPARVARPPRYGFVGRDAERARLSAMWEAATTGERGVALLYGEPGIGKTTLVGEMARTAASNGAIVLYGRCDAELGRPYQPFLEAFEHLVTHAPSALLADHMARHAGGLLNQVAATGLRFGGRDDAGSRDPDAERDALFAAAVDLLASASAYSPLVLVLDDLHWADRDTLLLLRHLVVADVSARLLVLATAREDELERSPLAEIGPTLHREPGVERLSIRALDEEDTRRLLELASGQDVGGPGKALSETVHRESGGNPFFVVELLRHLAETGAVTRDEEGRWIASGDEVELPDNVRDVVAHRVARLGADTGRILAAASVLGRDVDLSLAEVVVGASEDEVLTAFEDAGRALLVHDAPGRPGSVTFSHAIVQHTLYEQLSTARRLRLHRRAAETLEQRHADSRVAERARHWAIAATGGDPLDREAAARAAQAAGAEADERLAPDEACRWYGQALELRGEAADRDTASLLIALGTAQRQAGDAAFRDTLLRSARLAHDLGDAELLVAAALANNRGIQSGTGVVDEERIEALRWALQAAPADDHADRARLLALLALEQLYLLSYEERRELADEAIVLAQQADDVTLLRVLNLVHNAIKSPRSLEQRVHTTAQALELSARVGDPADRFWAIDQRVRCLGETGGLAEADALLDEAEGIATTLARPVMLYMVSMHRTWRAIVAGDLDKAERWAEATHAVGSGSGQPEADALFGSHLLRIRREQGKGGELVELLEAVAAANEGIPALKAALAALLALSGDTERAAELVRAQHETGFDKIHHDNLWSSALAEWAEAAAIVGDAEAAAALLPMLEPMAGTVVHNGATSSGPVDRIIALLLATLGRTDEALAALERAERLARDGDMPTYVAHSLVGRAGLLVGTDPEQAAALAAEAEQIGRSCGAELVCEHAARVQAGALG